MANTDTGRRAGRSLQGATTETKPAFKTTEMIFYLLAVAGVLIASAMVDENDNG